MFTPITEHVKVQRNGPFPTVFIKPNNICKLYQKIKNVQTLDLVILLLDMYFKETIKYEEVSLM